MYFYCILLNNMLAGYTGPGRFYESCRVCISLIPSLVIWLLISVNHYSVVPCHLLLTEFLNYNYLLCYTLPWKHDMAQLNEDLFRAETMCDTCVIFWIFIFSVNFYVTTSALKDIPCFSDDTTICGFMRDYVQACFLARYILCTTSQRLCQARKHF